MTLVERVEHVDLMALATEIFGLPYDVGVFEDDGILVPCQDAVGVIFDRLFPCASHSKYLKEGYTDEEWDAFSRFQCRVGDLWDKSPLRLLAESAE